MTYVDRLQPNIKLTSPSGQIFTPKWIGNEVTTEKDVGIFKTPGVNGVKVQDLSIGASEYPLTLHFDGPDHDLEATRFVETLSESGTWVIIHPVKGEKILQPLTVTEQVQPVTSGGITTVPTTWIEVTDAQAVKSAAQLSAETVAQNVTVSESATDQLENTAILDTADKSGKFKNAVESVVSAYDLTIGTIASGVAEVQAQADSIKRGIDSVLSVIPIDVLSIAGQVQALVNLPNLVQSDLSARIDSYSRFADEILTISPDSPSPAGISTASVQELALTAAVGAVGVASVFSVLASRQDVINNIEANIELFTTVTNGLDQIQELYVDKLLKDSYFSQSESFADTSRLVSLAVSYLLKSAFDLAVEKRIILTKQENPVMIAMREYNGPGENDESIDLFYSSNNLSGQECYLLPVDREIVVYL